jgi:hypothetical protein
MSVLAVLLSVAVAASVPPAAAPGNAGASQPDPNERVCRRTPPTLDTRIAPRRVCRTRGEWEAEARAAQQDWANRHRPASGDDR